MQCSLYVHKVFRHLFQTLIYYNHQFIPRCVFCCRLFFFQKSLKLFLLQMMSFQKLVAFVALMVFASQVAMAAPQPEHQPALVLRAPQPPPFKFKSPIHEDV